MMTSANCTSKQPESVCLSDDFNAAREVAVECELAREARAKAEREKAILRLAGLPRAVGRTLELV